MPLNLINDRWIPVRLNDGSRRLIAPWEMVDPEILAPDWPRADLNIACYELLIGLVFMADPPANLREWRDRQPEPERLRARLEPFTPAFNLIGPGPRFLQDLEPLEGNPNPVDMLFIDSSGANAARNNADLMVHRKRYSGLDLGLAAMAIYTLQAFAPSGGAGNRTSMRGGGPMVTLVDPGQGLWSLIWANVPYGQPAEAGDLPWMRTTRESKDKHGETYPDHAHPSEAFFGMPRRLRLVDEAGQITSVIQRPYGTNYAGWLHPLSPYYRQKPGSDLLPVHPRPGSFGYRNWLGVVARDSDDKGLRQRAEGVENWAERSRGRSGPPSTVIVAGWAMDNMKPRSFLHSVQPLIEFREDRDLLLDDMIWVADQVGVALRGALRPVLAEGEAREAVREEFFARTQGSFDARLAALAREKLPDDFSTGWVSDLRAAALDLFDARALPGLDRRDAKQQGAIIKARRGLLGLRGGRIADFLARLASFQEVEA